MTKFQKQMLTIAAAGALTAVTALPAMAFENEFHGAYWFNSIYSTASMNGESTTDATKFLSTTDKTNSFMEQRVRLQYSAKASDDLKLVTQFEINNRYGKKSTAGQTTLGIDFVGSDVDTDGTNILTKHAYLDFNVVKGTNVKIGLMPYKDSIGGILLDADLPAVALATKLGGVDVLAGFARTGDNNVTTSTRLGDQTQDFTFVDLSYNVNKSTKVGASYYLFSDDASTPTTKKTINTFALNGQTSINGVNLKGFVALQDGESGTTDYKGYAYNLQATTALAGGNAKLGYLYVSGDTNSGTKDTQFQPVQSAKTSTFNDSGMMLMIRNNKFATTSTNFMKGEAVSNIALAYAGYNKPLTDKLSLDLNVGFGWDNTDTRSGGITTADQAGAKGDFIGTEVNAEIAYKLYKELTVAAQVGYISLGSQYDAYKDPYAVRLAVTYSF